MSYLFSGLIKCEGCGKNYRGKLERKRRVYLCGGYHNKTSNCERFTIREEELIEIIRKHFNSDIINLEYINIIEVDKQRIVIKYSDDSQSIMSATQYIV